MADKQLLEAEVVGISPLPSYQGRSGLVYKSSVKFKNATVHETGNPAVDFDESIAWEQGHLTKDNPWSVGETVTFEVAQTGQYNRIKKETPYNAGGSGGSKKPSSGMQPSRSFSSSSSNNDDRAVAIELQSSMKLAMDAVVSDGGSSTDFSMIESTTLKFYEMLQRMKKTVS
jgi:hypothetical protein